MEYLNNYTGVQVMTRNVKSLPTESQDQIKFATWLSKMGIKFTASANGGSRNLIEAAKFKRMGVSPGFPDIEIPLPSGRYHGLYIELKRESPKGKLTHQQIDWINYLREKGYYADVAYGFKEAQAIVLQYLAFTPWAA